MTIARALQSINAYPVQAETIEAICLGRGIDPSDEASADVVKLPEYLLAKADVMLWLSKAPNISQGGQNYSFSEYERKRLEAEASAIFAEAGDGTARTNYGYKGNRL